MTARSWLFVPADAPDKLARAAGRGADALIVDLEDAVPLDGKPGARTSLAAWLAHAPGDGPQVWVRVNNDEAHLGADLDVALRPGVAGVVLPKVASAGQAADLAAAVDGRGGGPHGMVAMIETAAGVLEAAAVAATPGVTTLMVGEYDLAAELGMDPSPDRRELAPARAAVVLACAAAGIEPPVAPVSANFRDVDEFRAGTEALRREGHWGRAVIHPAQIGPVNDVFTPADAQLAHARRILQLYESARRTGKGVCLDDDGNLVDEAIVRGSRRVVAAAAAAGLR